jgi:hypothetical protein
MGVQHGALAAEMRGSRPAGELSGFDECLFGDGTNEDSRPGKNLQAPFTTHRAAALALLNGEGRLTRKAGSFLGQCVCDSTPLSDAQCDWLQSLLDRAGLPPLATEGAR